MTKTNEEIMILIDMLPEDEQIFAYEFIKRLIRAWDPDFTKLTPKEKRELEEADNDEYIDSTDIDWDNLDKLDL